MPRGTNLRAAPFQGLSALSAYLGWTHLAKRLLSWLAVAFQAIWSLCPGLWRRPGTRQALPESWQSCPELRIYRGGRGGGGDGGGALFTIYTNPYSFQVDLAHLATKSAYFAALSRSHMQEASERRLNLEHVPSASFHAILEWVFFGRFSLAEENILPAVQSASYLLFSGFLDRCRVALRPWLDPQNCLSYLHFAETVACPELRAEVCQFLSAHLLELALPVTGHLDPKLREELAQLRLAGPPRLCILRKENIAPQDPKKPLLGLYHRPMPPEEGDWHCATQLPFQAEKWSLSTAQLLNYLFILGGYRERRGARGCAFRAVASRYNPLTGTWMPIAAPNKRRRHFSTAVEGNHIYAIGGWYLDSLLSPDSTTCLYGAVERYDPWTDSWAFVSSLPMGDFSFTVSLSHDLPLCTAHKGFVYALGSIQRTGEKLLLCYDVAADSWQELLPTLTRADADLPGLYFLGGTEPLYVVGGNAQDNVVVSFNQSHQQWGPVHSLPKCSLAGQGLAVGEVLYMASPDLGAILEVDLGAPDCHPLPPPPFPLYYEAFFLLHFPLEDPGEDSTEREGAWRL